MHGTGGDCGVRVAPEIVTRPATKADIDAYYGGIRHGTLRAMVAEMDGRIVGIVGLVREPDAGKFFSEFAPELEPYLGSIRIMRAVKQAMQYVFEYQGPVIAISEGPKSVKLLTKLGFEHLEGELWAWLS